MKTLRFMKILVLAFCCLHKAGDCIAQTSPRFTLHLSSSNPQVKDGSEEVVVIQMTNTWNHPLAYSVGGPGGPNLEFHFRIVDQHGQNVRETPFGMKMHDTDPNSHGWTGSMGTGLLPIGETQTRKINLGKEYDLSAPGVYRVTASRFDQLSHITVTSNEVQFTVLSTPQ
jgi:hypothetical protein